MKKLDLKKTKIKLLLYSSNKTADISAEENFVSFDLKRKLATFLYSKVLGYKDMLIQLDFPN